MALVTVARYRLITGDTTSLAASVVDAIALAEELLADALCRPLASAERTEKMWPDAEGRLWPSATPITAAGSYTIDGNGLIGVFGPGWPDTTGAVSVVYTGGWVERTANPGAANALPTCIEADLAWVAKSLVAPDASATQYPAGATSVRLGDAAVTFGPDGPPRPGVASVRWSRPTLRYRYHTVRSC